MTTERDSGRPSPETKKRRSSKPANFFFFAIFLIIILCQTFYWLFANQVQPFLFGMPLGLFVLTALITLEFVFLIILYKSEGS